MGDVLESDHSASENDEIDISEMLEVMKKANIDHNISEEFNE